MARIDRRKTYPLLDKSNPQSQRVFTDQAADATLTTRKVGGVIAVRGTTPANLIASTLRYPYLYKVWTNRFYPSGTSKFYGSRR